jgi:chloramphenicol 3-O-phosphotransferase
MGNACGGTQKMDPASRAIEQQLREDKRKLNDEMKILLLGAGESGKSTIAKQFKIINNGDYSEEELKDYKVFILDNTFASIKALVNAADKLAIDIGEKAAERSEDP